MSSSFAGLQDEIFGLYAQGRYREAYQLLERSGIDVKLEVVPELGHAYPPGPARKLRSSLDFIIR